MVSGSKTFDVLKYGKMTELTQTKHRFGILAGFSYIIAFQTGFENSTGNTKHSSKDAQENSTSFDINVVLVGGGANMVFNEKLTKNRKLRGLKLRGLRRNQINTPNFTYGNVQRNKTNLFGDFEN